VPHGGLSFQPLRSESGAGFDDPLFHPVLPVTMIGNVPVGVEPVVLIVSWLEQVGLHAPGLNPAVAPLGSRPDRPRPSIASAALKGSASFGNPGC